MAAVIDQPIIFFGVDRFPALPLEQLLANGYALKAIFAAPDKDARNGQKVAPIAKQLGVKYAVPVFQPIKSREILPLLQSLETTDWYKTARPIGILVSYGKIIPQEVLDWFAPLPILNLHPSLLPKYRGSSPVESAILQGDDQTGVSIIKLVAAMDAGPILASATIPITPEETSSSLYHQAAKTGWQLLTKVLPAVCAGNTTSQQQDDTAATYSERFAKATAELTSGATAVELERKVRAFDYNPKAFFFHDGKRFTVQAGVISPTRQTPLDIATSDGQFYSPTIIAPEGKSSMSLADYLRGQQAR